MYFKIIKITYSSNIISLFSSISLKLSWIIGDKNHSLAIQIKRLNSSLIDYSYIYFLQEFIINVCKTPNQKCQDH